MKQEKNLSVFIGLCVWLCVCSYHISEQLPFKQLMSTSGLLTMTEVRKWITDKVAIVTVVTIDTLVKRNFTYAINQGSIGKSWC